MRLYKRVESEPPDCQSDRCMSRWSIGSIDVEKPLEDEKPDGGCLAWLQVFGGWLLVLNTRGLINSSFGVFQTYYEENLPDATPSAVSSIGSTQGFLLMFIGIICGRLLDAGYLRLQIAIGISLQFFGLMMASFSTQYWQILLSQGLCVGLGAGFLYLPSVVVISQYFSSKIMFATGIAATGSCAAGILYPILVRELISNIGFSWTMRVLAFIVLALNGIPLAVMRLRNQPKTSDVIFSLSVFRDLPYAVFVIAMVFLFVSVYIPYFYVTDYVLDNGVGPETSFYILSVMNVTSIFGRILPNWLADKVGGLVMIICCCLLTCVVIFTWLTIHSKVGIIIIVAAYGFASGGLVSLPPSTIASLSKNPDEYGTRVGMAFTICSFGALVGNPIAGALLPPSVPALTQRFLKPWLFGGGTMLFAAALMLLTAYLSNRASERVRVEGRQPPPVYQTFSRSQVESGKVQSIRDVVYDKI